MMPIVYRLSPSANTKSASYPDMIGAILKKINEQDILIYNIFFKSLYDESISNRGCEESCQPLTNHHIYYFLLFSLIHITLGNISSKSTPLTNNHKSCQCGPLHKLEK